MNADRPKSNEIAHIKDLLQQIMAGCRRPENKEMLKIKEVWNQIVQDPLAGHAHPAAIENGTLIIQVGNSVITQQLRFQTRTIIRGINRHLGGDRIKDIRIKISSV